MALVTIQRSPSPSNDPEADTVDGVEESGSSRSPLRQRRSSSALKRLRKFFNTVRFITKLRPCLSESYFTVKGAALILPQNECSRRTSKKNHGGDMQHHLQAMLHLLRPEDKMKMAVKLENAVASLNHRYLALVSTIGREDGEEFVILGIDCKDTATIGLVIPILSGTKIRLDGDGGFSVQTYEGVYLFKPVSVQVMWSALQSLNKAVSISDTGMYTTEGLSHTWISYYVSKIDTSDQDRFSQWHTMEGVLVDISALVPSYVDDNEEICNIKKNITKTLCQIMMSVDLDEATCVSLRNATAAKLEMDLKPYKEFFDAEVMRILGQMDGASKITDLVYLGSEWNAANAAELQEIGIGFILNVTLEIDNFFQGMFKYKNIRLPDVPESDLLRHWDKTYDFIDKARKENSKVLIHCKMGISRSSATTMAFLMKDNKWSFEEAYKYVQERRNCVNPNEGFREQLKTYEGILKASNQRQIFHHMSMRANQSRSQSEDTEDEQDFLENGAYVGIEPSELPLRKPNISLQESEYIAQFPIGVSIPIEPDLETGSRSADSMEESLPDMHSPTPLNENVTKTGSYHFNIRHSNLVSGEVAGADLPYDTSSEYSEDDEGINILGRESRSTLLMSSSVPSGPSAFKDDFSWIKSNLSDGENSPSVDQSAVAPNLIIASDFNYLPPPDLNTNSKNLETGLENQLLTNEEMNMDMPSTKASTMYDTGIKDYYMKEAIPWNSGKVQQIRAGLVNTNLKDSLMASPSTDNAFDNDPMNNPKTKMVKEELSISPSVELTELHAKVNERGTLGMKCSHSCSELMSMDSETERPSKRQCPVSLYEIEQIPLPEGIVRKTMLEIESKARSIPPDLEEFVKPIQRSSSLKEATEKAKAKRAERRKTCSPIVSPSIPSGQSLPSADYDDNSDTCPTPRPLVILEGTKPVSSPECDTPEVVITGVTTDESTDADVEDIKVYKYGSEVVPLKSGIVQKHKKEFETMVTSDSNESDIGSTECKDITSVTASTTSHIPVTQQKDNVGQKVTNDAKICESHVSVAHHPIRLKKEKCPYNEEVMNYIHDMGSMLSHRTSEDEMDTNDTSSAVFNVVRDFERKTKPEKKHEKKIVIIDSDGKKYKNQQKSTTCSNETVQTSSAKTGSPQKSKFTIESSSVTELTDRSILNLDLNSETAHDMHTSVTSPVTPITETGHSSTRCTPQDHDHSVVKHLLYRFEAPKDTSQVSEDNKSTPLQKPDPVKQPEIVERHTLLDEVIDESEEDSHLSPEYVQMRNKLVPVDPGFTQRTRPNSSDVALRQALRTKSVSDTAPTFTSRNVNFTASGESRSVRRVQHGASHPLARLGANPFYNTM
ncbi:uncharacterized protein LOC126823323 isoform X2 [Patella vulgata]|uniref:uncharacterized protein LOC126823323 isoform X2 n=1 Tax=Patella vulgata TaxID=6465 RepID=UPI002180412A|nr:uncharacterized protein LOC126823323 isoform X2 [Patella vulgata]